MRRRGAFGGTPVGGERTLSRGEIRPLSLRRGGFRVGAWQAGDEDQKTWDISSEGQAVIDAETDFASVPPEPVGTGASGVPAFVQPEAPPIDPILRRRYRRCYAFGGFIGFLITVITIANYVTVPYFTIAPGSVRSTEPLVTVDGAPTFASDGEISFTTVSVGEATAFTAALGWLDPSVEVIPRKAVLGDQQPEENRKRNLEMMDGSKQTAQVVALRRLGYDVTATGTGAVIAFVKEGSPADSVLDPNDVVLSVDGVPVKIADDLVSSINTKQPGDTITLEIEPGNGDPIRKSTTTVVARESDPSKPMLGIQAGTRNLNFDLPFVVSIDSGDVGGPSAGLAFTLGVIDVLTPGSLTGGKSVATTGTMDLQGNVGPVGGVPQKTVGVRRSGAKLFLVPPDEYDEAVRFAGDMQVVAVRTLDEALDAIAKYGNDPSAVALASAGPLASQ